MLAHKSADGGLTWGPGVPLVGLRCAGDDKGWIACDDTVPFFSGPFGPVHGTTPASPYHGRLYAVWAAATPLRFARSVDGGQHWTGVGAHSAGADVTTFAAYARDISIAENGTIHVFWHSPGTASIQYLRSKDGGETFEGSGMAGAFPQPRTVVTGLTDIHSGISARAGGWPVFTGASFRVLTIVAACCFGDQGVAIACADARSGNSRVYYRLSLDNGDTWLGDESGTPLLPNLVGDSHQFHPQLAETRSGVLGCAMYSYGRTAAPGNRPGVAVLLAASFDSGVTWSFRPITDQAWDPGVNAPWSHGDSSVTFIGEYFGFDADARDFHLLWTDTRHGNQDLFYCRVATESRRGPDDFFEQLAATLVSAGVSHDGGGFVIVGGRIIRIPPWDPLHDVLHIVSAPDSLAGVKRASTTRARDVLYDLMINVAKQAQKDLRQG